jgi:hypothetical protein
MGCIARLGCLFVLAILCVAGWFTRDRWLPERFRTTPSRTAATTDWQPVTRTGADRTRAALTKLSEPRGPVFQNLTAGDVASYAFAEMGRKVGGSVDSVAARIDGERMTMRAIVNLAALKGKLGPLGGMLSERETVEMSGTVQMIKPGLAALSVETAKVGRIALPQGMIPRLVKEIDSSRRPEGLPDNALPLQVPSYVGDIRLANGKVTLYKNVQ